MIRYAYANDLHRFPKLRRTMFRDRAIQFRDRLNWAVEVNGDGEEHDQYDALNPLYVIWERADGSHGGSMRFLPTTGRTMVNDLFLHLTDGVRIESGLIWECTRFCLAPDADRRVAAALVLGAAELMPAFHLSHFVGVFDPKMERIYAMLGVEPTVIGRSGAGAEALGIGLWEFNETARPRLQARAGLTHEVVRLWFERAFGSLAPRLAA